MRKLFTIALLVIGMITNAQDYNQVYGKRDKAWYPFATLGFDVRNCIDGSKPTKGRAEADVQFKLGARTNHWEVSAMYEAFPAIDFEFYGANVNFVTEVIKNTDIAIGTEFGMINRWEGFNFYTGGANLELRYEVKNTPIIFGLQGNARVRPDIWYKNSPMPITKSFWVNVTYKFN